MSVFNTLQRSVESQGKWKYVTTKSVIVKNPGLFSHFSIKLNIKSKRMKICNSFPAIKTVIVKTLATFNLTLSVQKPYKLEQRTRSFLRKVWLFRLHSSASRYELMTPVNDIVMSHFEVVRNAERLSVFAWLYLKYTTNSFVSLKSRIVFISCVYI